MTKLLIGADPEVFVRKGVTYVSAHLFPCGTKAHPTKTKHGFVQIDGLALEFNTIPTDDKTTFVNAVTDTLVDLVEIVDAKDKDCKIDISAAAYFRPEYIAALPEKIKELGCHPDFNGYTDEMNPSPSGYPDNLRTAAGHIHLGWCENAKPFDEEHFVQCQSVARQLDYYVGLRSLDWDSEATRRLMYGKAGSFRPKPYGMEYRVLSNRWLKDKHTIGLVFELTQTAFEHWEKGRRPYDTHGAFARYSIDEHKTDWRKQNPKLVTDLHGV